MLESTIILSVLIVLMVFFLKEALSITLTKQETSPLDKPSSTLPLSEFFVNLFYINNLTIIPSMLTAKSRIYSFSKSLR